MNPVNPEKSCASCSKSLTTSYNLRYKPESMFRNTDHGHRWHYHHVGGGLAIVFAVS